MILTFYDDLILKRHACFLKEQLERSSSWRVLC